MCTLCTLYYAYTNCILAFHFLRPSFVALTNLAYTPTHAYRVNYIHEYVRPSTCALCIEILNWYFGNRLLRERFPESVMSLSYLGEISVTFILLYSFLREFYGNFSDNGGRLLTFFPLICDFVRRIW